MSSILPEVKFGGHYISLGLQPEWEDVTSVVCVGPKAKPVIRCSAQWRRGGIMWSLPRLC